MSPGNVEQPQAEILLTFSADSGAVKPPKSLLHSQFGLEAEVGIDPENSIADRKIVEFACQSTNYSPLSRHYSSIIIPRYFVSHFVSHPWNGSITLTPAQSWSDVGLVKEPSNIL